MEGFVGVKVVRLSKLKIFIKFGFSALALRPTLEGYDSLESVASFKLDNLNSCLRCCDRRRCGVFNLKLGFLAGAFINTWQPRKIELGDWPEADDKVLETSSLDVLKLGSVTDGFANWWPWEQCSCPYRRTQSSCWRCCD